MNHADIAYLMKKISEVWPNWNSHMSPERMPNIVEDWMSILSDVTLEAAGAAIASLAKDGREFAPNVGIIYARASQMMKAINPELNPEPEWDAARAWAAVCAAIRPFGYGAMWDATARDALPPHIVQCAEDYGIYRIAVRQTEDEHVNYAQWRDTFNIRNERHERDKSISPAVREMLQGVAAKLKIGAPKEQR